MIKPILGLISFVGAIIIFTSSFVEGNLILTSSIVVLIFLESLYHFLKDEKDIIKGTIKIISVLTLIVGLFFKIPFYLTVIVGAALLIVAIYDIFPTIIEAGD